MNAFVFQAVSRNHAYMFRTFVIMFNELRTMNIEVSHGDFYFQWVMIFPSDLE